jgi:hypothetical protein
MLTVKPIRITVIDCTGVAVTSRADQVAADRADLADLRACLAVPRWRQWWWHVQARNWRAMAQYAMRAALLATALAYSILAWGSMVWALVHTIWGGGR